MWTVTMTSLKVIAASVIACSDIAYAVSRAWLYSAELLLSEKRIGPGSELATGVVPLWYRPLRPMSPDSPPTWTVETVGTLRDASTPIAARLGAESSRIRQPRSL
jgi:hypothetical protein